VRKKRPTKNVSGPRLVYEPTDRRAQIAAHSIASHEAEYARGHNPLHVWRASVHARHAGLELPGWVLTYLDGVAHTFWNWSSASVPVPQPLPSAIAEALGMLRGRGETTVFAEFKDVGSLGLAGLVDQDRRNPRGPQKLIHSWDHVAKTAGVHPSVVRRAWHKHKDRFIVS
jgi:hypothetical protein